MIYYSFRYALRYVMEPSLIDTDMAEAPRLPDRSLPPTPEPGTTPAQGDVENICAELDGAEASVQETIFFLQRVRNVVNRKEVSPEGYNAPHAPVPSPHQPPPNRQINSRPQENLHSVIQAMREELNTKEAALRDARTDLARVREEKARLRKIVLDKTGDQRVLDELVKDKFVSLRQKAQVIANSSAYDVNRPIAWGRAKIHRVFDHKVWTRLTTKDRKDNLMAEIFDQLYFDVFDYKMFFRQVVPSDQGTGDRKSTVELDLQRYESLLKDSNVNETLINNWRIASIECCAELGNSQAPRGRKLSRSMFEAFQPIISAKADKKQLEDLQDQLTALCNEAWDLRLIMRKSREGHRCVRPPTRDKRCFLEDFENLVEPISVEGGNTKEKSDEIAYSLFGALVKDPAGAGHAEGEVVLEKAQVVLKRR
jgi:hypothetical protein